MARYCGGIKHDATLKIINGVLCDAGATSVDVSKAVTTCGQLWDGSLFTKVVQNGKQIITLHDGDGEAVGEAVPVNGNCGVGLDGRFFKVADGVVSLQDGFVLTVNVTPADATITVADAEGANVAPVSGKTNAFLLGGIGDQYTVTVSKDGYTTKTQTVSNNSDQTITIELMNA